MFLVQLADSESYTPVVLLRHRHGVIAGARYTSKPVPRRALERLHVDERAEAHVLGPASVSSFVAGRVALHGALKALSPGSRMDGPILRAPGGAPTPPRGFAVSIAHTASIALALASLDTGHGIGIDLAALSPEYAGLAGRVLGEAEIRDLEAFEAAAQWREVLIRFVAKEAIYKAVGGVGDLRFKDLAITSARGEPGADGFCEANVSFRQGGGAAKLSGVEAEVTYTAGEELVVATARASGLPRPH